MLGKYSTKVILPKTKSELISALRELGKIEIRVIEPIDKKNVGLVKSEIDKFVGNGQSDISLVFIKKN